MTNGRWGWIVVVLVLCSCVQGQDTPRLADLWQHLSQIDVAGFYGDPPQEVVNQDQVFSHVDVAAFLAAHPELAAIDLIYLQGLEDAYGPGVALEWLNDQLMSRDPRPPLPPIRAPETGE